MIIEICEEYDGEARGRVKKKRREKGERGENPNYVFDLYRYISDNNESNEIKRHWIQPNCNILRLFFYKERENLLSNIHNKCTIYHVYYFIMK
jgi:hypothetical protein